MCAVTRLAPLIGIGRATDLLDPEGVCTAGASPAQCCGALWGASMEPEQRLIDDSATMGWLFSR